MMAEASAGEGARRVHFRGELQASRGLPQPRPYAAEHLNLEVGSRAKNSNQYLNLEDRSKDGNQYRRGAKNEHKDTRQQSVMDGQGAHARFQEENTKNFNSPGRRSAERQEHPARGERLDVQGITCQLKQSYENVDRRQDILKRVSDELHQSKNRLRGQRREGVDSGAVRDVERMLTEVEELRKHLQSAGKLKKRYLEELSLLQTTLRQHRAEMDEGCSQVEMIGKLRRDNESLRSLLQEVQAHLRQEDPTQPEPPVDRKLYSQVVALSRGEEGESSRSSNSSSYNENYISDQLRYLVEQSEHIRLNIPTLLNSDESATTPRMDPHSPRVSWDSARDCRLPAENEKGERSDMNEIMLRCEELERKVQHCSTRDIRQRLVQQLHDIDQESSSSSNNNKEQNNLWNGQHPNNSRERGESCLWNEEQHNQARSDILKCLDKIVLLEKNFNETHQELMRLKNYIKDSGEEKEFSEKSYKREALQLRQLVEEKSQEINLLKDDLKNSLKYLKENESLHSKIELLQQQLSEKEIENASLRSKVSETKLLKDALDRKSRELNNLKIEMREALDKMDNLKRNSEEGCSTLKSELRTLEGENKRLRVSVRSDIQEELNLLQRAIVEAEKRMEVLSKENSTLKEESSDQPKLVNRVESCQEQLAKVTLELAVKTQQANELHAEIKQKDAQIAYLSDQVQQKRLEESKDVAAIEENLRLLEEIAGKNEVIAEFKHALENVGKDMATDGRLDDIRNSVRASHYELVEKVIALHQELKDMKHENGQLRNGIPDSRIDQEEDGHVRKRFERLREDNNQLKEQVMGLEQLSDETKLLKTALNGQQKELVESNLRKRDRIKQLEKQLKESSPITAFHRHFYNEQNVCYKCEGQAKGKQRTNSQSNDDIRTKDNPFTEGKEQSSGLPPKGKSKKKRSETSEKAAFAEMMQQNEIIRKLQEENKKLLKNTHSNQEVTAEIENLKSEREKFKQTIESHEEEIRLLNNRLLETYEENAVTPIGDREHFNSDQIANENKALKKDLAKALKDIEGLIEIIDRRNTFMSRPLQGKSASMGDLTLKSDLKKDYSTSQQCLEEMTTENAYLRRELRDTEQSHLKAAEEASELKAALKAVSSAKSSSSELEEVRKALVAVEKEKLEMKNELTDVQAQGEQRVALCMQALKAEKALLEEECERLNKERDEGSGRRSSTREPARLIRRLQVESQTLRGKLMSLEEEGVEIIKIVADMERGHGHVTGTLRTHLVLQSTSTAKLLESSIEQYTVDFETFRRKFKALEGRYDREKKYSKRRDHAWEMFTSASASIANIQNILHEGFIKLDEEDVESEAFLDRDYKSRLWILRRQLSDVDKRHRELQLRAEELNLRLHAKTTEYEVTQDELEDTTRDLESRDVSMQTLRYDALKLNKENDMLQTIIQTLKDNQEKTVKQVLAENDSIRADIDRISAAREDSTKGLHQKLMETKQLLETSQKSLQEVKRTRDQAQKKTEGVERRVVFLERKLREMTESRDKLKAEIENRVGYMAKASEDKGTIHMLRDDLKTLAKDNSQLKEEITAKKRQMYEMSKDLHQLRLRETENDKSRPRQKDGLGTRLMQEIAELKAEKIMLESRLKKADKKSNSANTSFVENDLKERLVEKEAEIQALKQSMYLPRHRSKSPAKESEVVRTMRDQHEMEMSILTKDTNTKRKRIKELLSTIDNLKTASGEDGENLTKLVAEVKSEEANSVFEELKLKDSEVSFWKEKAEFLERDLIGSRRSGASTEDDKFKSVYLHKMTPMSGSALSGGFLDTPDAAKEQYSLYEDINEERTYDISESDDLYKRPSRIPKRRPAKRTSDEKKVDDDKVIESLLSELTVFKKTLDIDSEYTDVTQLEQVILNRIYDRTQRLNDEKDRLNELVETQTENVECQERVIKSLKEDMEGCKQKYVQHCDRISKDLKNKKQEIKDLKNEIKELASAPGVEKRSGISNDRLNTRVLELEVELKSQEERYEEVLKQAESAMEDAKEKLIQQKDKNDDLSRQVHTLVAEKQSESRAGDEYKLEIEQIRVELEGEKMEKEEMSRTIKELQKEASDYKLLVEQSASTISEFVTTHSNQQRKGSTDNTLDMISEERTEDDGDIDFAIECEILKGCNEDLEEELKRAKEEAKQEKERVEEEREMLRQKVTELQEQVEDLENREVYHCHMDKLHRQAEHDRSTIEQLESIVDEMEVEIKENEQQLYKETMTRKQLTNEYEEAVKDLESEVKSKLSARQEKIKNREIEEKQREIEKLQTALEEWIRKSIDESVNVIGPMSTSRTKNLLQQSQRLLNTSTELEMLTNSLNGSTREDIRFPTNDDWQRKIGSLEEEIEKRNEELKENTQLEVSLRDTILKKDNVIAILQTKLQSFDSTCDGEEAMTHVVERSTATLLNKNKIMSRENHRLQQDLQTMQSLSEHYEEETNLLKQDLQLARDKLSQLRQTMHGNQSDPSRGRLFAAYEEIREKTVEIASLNLKLDIKTREVEMLRKDHLDVVYPSPLPPTRECTHSTNLKDLVSELHEREASEHEFMQQNIQLRNQLLRKSKHCDFLQNELFKLVGKVKQIERSLMIQEQALREKYVMRGVESPTTEAITEVTPLSTTFTQQQQKRTKSLHQQDEANDTILLDGFQEEVSEAKEYRRMLDDERRRKNDELVFCREQLAELRVEVAEVNRQKKEMTRDVEGWRHKFYSAEKQLKLKTDEVTKLNKRLTELNNTVTNQAYSLKKCEQERSALVEQLETQRRCHTSDLSNTKSTYARVREEQITSLKAELTGATQEKLRLQVQVKELEFTQAKREKQREKKEEEFQRKEEEVKELTNTLALLEAENVRLTDSLNARR